MLYTSNKALAALLCILVGFTSCEVIDPVEPTASYISIDYIDLVVLNPGEEGSESHAIVDAWVYANDELVGAFELPARVPILEEGNTKITIYAGIKNNGFSSLRLKYPYYTKFESYYDLIPGETVDVDPVVNYYNAAIVTIVDDFDVAGINFEPGPFSDTNITEITTAGYVFEGSGSGEAYLDVAGGMSIWESRSTKDLLLPVGGEIYLEMNYACNDTMLVGIVAESIISDEKNGIIFLTPTFSGNGLPVYNKIYIQLSSTVGNYVSADAFEVYFEMLHGGGSIPYQPVAYFDNIKICHF